MIDEMANSRLKLDYQLLQMEFLEINLKLN